MSPDEIRRVFGISFEEEQHQADIAYWQMAPEAEFGQTIADLMRHAETVLKETELQDYRPAPRVPFENSYKNNERRE